MSYKKWWLRKFEFTQRHAVHEHEISKRVFLFPKYESIRDQLQRGQDLEPLDANDDFVEVEFKGERLASCSIASCTIYTRSFPLYHNHIHTHETVEYTEQGAVNRVMLRRCLMKAKQARNRFEKSTSAADRVKWKAARWSAQHSTLDW